MTFEIKLRECYLYDDKIHFIFSTLVDTSEVEYVLKYISGSTFGWFTVVLNSDGYVLEKDVKLTELHLVSDIIRLYGNEFVFSCSFFLQVGKNVKVSIFWNDYENEKIFLKEIVILENHEVVYDFCEDKREHVLLEYNKSLTNKNKFFNIYSSKISEIFVDEKYYYNKLFDIINENIVKIENIKAEKGSISFSIYTTKKINYSFCKLNYIILTLGEQSVFRMQDVDLFLYDKENRFLYSEDSIFESSAGDLKVTIEYEINCTYYISIAKEIINILLLMGDLLKFVENSKYVGYDTGIVSRRYVDNNSSVYIQYNNLLQNLIKSIGVFNEFFGENVFSESLTKKNLDLFKNKFYVLVSNIEQLQTIFNLFVENNNRYGVLKRIYRMEKVAEDK